MDFYFVDRDYRIAFTLDGVRVSYTFLRSDPARITGDRLYFAPSDEIKRVIERVKRAGYEDFEVRVLLDKNLVFKHPKFPLDLTYSGGYHRKDEKFIPLEEKIEPLLGKEKVRVAVVNGMGGGIGDNIVGMTALNIFYDRMMHYFSEVEIGIFTLRPRGYPILQQETIVDEIYLMPAMVDLLFRYDAVVDLSNMTGWPIFKQPFMDFFIQAFSIDPSSVPPERKRCFVKLNERVARELKPLVEGLKASGRPVLVFHPLTSASSRSIPTDLWIPFIQEIISLADFTVVSLVKIDFEHPRFRDLSRWSYRGFDHFAFLVSCADAIFTVDTATTHLADAFSIPGVDLCTTIPPEWYVKYYPFLEGLLVGGGSFPETYCIASEDPDLLEKLRSRWESFRVEEALELVFRMMEKRARELPHLDCPVCGHANPFIPSGRYRKYFLIRCAECKGEYAHPREAMDYHRAWREERTETGDEYRGYLREDDPEKLYRGLIENPRFQAVRDFLENMPEKGTLLDVGCANGFFVRYAREIGFEAYGIDLSEEAVRYGRRHWRVPLAVCGDLDDLPGDFPSRYQVITAFEVVEHLEDPRSFVRKVRERLLPGGVFVFSTPNREMLGRRFGLKDERRFFIPGHRDAPPGHLTRFTDGTHRRLMEICGLEVLWQWVVPPRVGDLQRVLEERIRVPNLKVELSAGNLVEVPGYKLKPLVWSALDPMLVLLQEQGLFLITAARRVE